MNFDWKVSGRVTLFAEGRNLVNRRLYEYPWYPELGANFTVGVKANLDVYKRQRARCSTFSPCWGCWDSSA